MILRCCPICKKTAHSLRHGGHTWLNFHWASRDIPNLRDHGEWKVFWTVPRNFKTAEGISSHLFIFKPSEKYIGNNIVFYHFGMQKYCNIISVNFSEIFRFISIYQCNMSLEIIFNIFFSRNSIAYLFRKVCLF